MQPNLDVINEDLFDDFSGLTGDYTRLTKTDYPDFSADIPTRIKTTDLISATQTAQPVTDLAECRPKTFCEGDNLVTQGTSCRKAYARCEHGCSNGACNPAPEETPVEPKETPETKSLTKSISPALLLGVAGLSVVLMGGMLFKGK